MGCRSIVVSLDEWQCDCFVVLVLSDEDDSGFFQVLVLHVGFFFVELLSEVELLSGIPLQFVLVGLFNKLGQFII